MATGISWNSTTGVRDTVRAPQNYGGLGIFVNVEIKVTSTVREFTNTQLDNKKVAAVLESTAADPEVGLGSDGDVVFGFISDISNDGAVATLLILGLTDWVFYAAANEDPDVNNSVLSKGDGSVKQTPTATDIAAGGNTDGRGSVVSKDTTNTFVKIAYP